MRQWSCSGDNGISIPDFRCWLSTAGQETRKDHTPVSQIGNTSRQWSEPLCLAFLWTHTTVARLPLALHCIALSHGFDPGCGGCTPNETEGKQMLVLALWVHVKEPQVVEINPEAPAMIRLMIRSWFFTCKTAELFLPCEYVWRTERAVRMLSFRKFFIRSSLLTSTCRKGVLQGMF